MLATISRAIAWKHGPFRARGSATERTATVKGGLPLFVVLVVAKTHELLSRLHRLATVHQITFMDLEQGPLGPVRDYQAKNCGQNSSGGRRLPLGCLI